jgi:hypothetical protein
VPVLRALQKLGQVLRALQELGQVQEFYLRLTPPLF